MKLAPSVLAVFLTLGAGAALADSGPSSGSHAAGAGHRGQRLLERFDQNRDGQLDATEQAAADAFRAEKKAERQARKLARFDQNRDGQIDTTERARVRAARIDGMMTRLDRNRDGRITGDEMPAGKGQRLQQLDLDRNGAVTRDELERAPRHCRGGKRGPH